MKVFLFNPPGPSGRGFTREGRCTQEAGAWGTQWPPVSLVTAAAFLEKDGHDVTVADFSALGEREGRLFTLIGSRKYDLAVWNAATPTLAYDLGLAAAIKRLSPETVTAVTGTHVGVLPGDALHNDSLDIVIRREPEAIIRDLGSRGKDNWADVKGISYRNPGDGSILHNPDTGWIAPEDIPAPAWHRLDIRPYRLPLNGRPFLIVAPVRGCPCPCSFCTAPLYYGKKLRRRPVRNVVDEMQDDMARHGVNDFFIWADTFTIDAGYVKDFCREITSRKLRAAWTCNSRVDTVDRELLKMMREAGLWMISYGLESGSNAILEAAGKRITREDSVKAVLLARELGIRTSGHFIFGLPGETRETMRETLQFSLEIPLDIAQYYAAAPFPGTPLYDEAMRNGWLRQSPVSQSEAVMDLPDLPAEEVNAFRRLAYRRFYLRPKILLGLAAMMEPAGVVQILSNLKNFLRWTK